MSTCDEVLDWLLELPERSPLAIDTETTGLRPYQGDVIRGVSLAGVDGRSWYLPYSHPNTANIAQDDFWRILVRVSGHQGPLVFHHGKFDAAFLNQVAERDWLKDHRDTKVGTWLEDEAILNGLKERCSVLFGTDAAAERRALSTLMRGRPIKSIEDELYAVGGVTRKEANALARVDPRHQSRGWADLTGAEIEAYARQDAVLTLRLHDHLLTCPEATAVARAWPRECEFQRVLFDMERTGIRVDGPRVEVERAKALARMTELETTLEIGETNLASPAQVAELLYDRWGLTCRDHTPTGARATGRQTLEELAVVEPRVDLLLEYRRLAKATTAYFDPLLGRLDSEGRVHPTFESTGTKTGRRSCEAPNLQTIPRQDTLGVIRACFVPAEGYELWEFDLAQAELRVAAALSREPAMVAAFAESRDLYAETAAELGCKRQTAKTLLLSFQYGAEAPTMARTLLRGTGQRLTNGAVRRAGELQFRLRQLYPRLVHAMTFFEQVAREEGRIKLGPWPGRYRRFHHPGFVEEERKAFNSACQGGVAGVLEDLMLKSRPLFDELGARLVLEVHDSLVAEVPPGAGEHLGALLQSVVDDVNPFRSVRQIVEAKPWTHARPSAASSRASGGTLSASSELASVSPSLGSPEATDQDLPHLREHLRRPVRERDVQQILRSLPRTSQAKRLEGIGNAVVPQVAEWLGRWMRRADG